MQFQSFFTCQNYSPCVYFARPRQRILQNGVLAQLVERLNGIEKVSGSNPLCSSLRFFGEKTSAWQAFGFAKPTFLCSNAK